MDKSLHNSVSRKHLLQGSSDNSYGLVVVVVVVVVVLGVLLLGAVLTDGVLSSCISSTGNRRISIGSIAMLAMVLQRPTKKVAGPHACAGVGVTTIE